MMILQAFLTSLFAAAALFLLTKLMGYRQISQLSGYDYINGITIGSIAAELAFGGFEDFPARCTALLVFAGFTILLSLLTDRSVRLRAWISGKPLILMEKGKLCRENFKKGKMDVHEFLSLCRQQGYFDIAQLDTVYLEPDGRLSCSPRPLYRPATAGDVTQPAAEPLPLEVVTDGVILHQNLKKLGFEEKWLTRQLSEQKAPPPEQIFLALCSEEGQLTVY
ncbi:MAG: DUF421 domain-containing protein [Clostridia bacterium]|nr:DUF421 domain-containing protein [Clostridia bacterium]